MLSEPVTLWLDGRGGAFPELQIQLDRSNAVTAWINEPISICQTFIPRPLPGPSTGSIYNVFFWGHNADQVRWLLRSSAKPELLFAKN